MSAIKMDEIAEPFIRRRAVRHLEKEELLYFLLEQVILILQQILLPPRAIEVEADVILKGTRVDGIYTADPEKDTSAKI